MRGEWSSAYLRAQLAGGWVEVQRDLESPILDTILTDDHKVFIIYPERCYAVVDSIR
jgi:hypothetical protein